MKIFKMHDNHSKLNKIDSHYPHPVRPLQAGYD